MNKKILLIILFLSPQLIFAWGFYAHRVINRIAIFSLPPEMFLFYKNNCDYIYEHAVDADKRRYLIKEEACRHYIDIDRFEKSVPIDTIPAKWSDAVKKFSEDTLNAYGVAPWHIQIMLNRLSWAMKEKKAELILKLSSDIGHYIADANVPLHTSQNYNGQMTNQHGIHAFWESRLPEIYGERYDLFAGKAYYLENPLNYTWKLVEGSFNALDSVLQFEIFAKSKVRDDKHFTFEVKGQSTVKCYSKELCEMYHKKLGGMVERRMKSSIKSVANFWYTAWVDAGQPDLSNLLEEAKGINSEEERKKLAEEDLRLISDKKMIGRDEN